MSTTQFIKNPFPSRFCEIMNAPGTHDRKIAKYLIGQPNPSSVVNPGFLAVCDDCARSIVEKLPDELLPFVNVERALELISEEQKDAIFDKFFQPAGPKEVKEAIENYLDEMEPEERAVLLSKYIDAGPVQRPALPLDGDIQFQCPYCEFAAKSQAGLSSHIKAKHPEVSQ
jgi:hypothetical protein